MRSIYKNNHHFARSEATRHCDYFYKYELILIIKYNKTCVRTCETNFTQHATQECIPAIKTESQGQPEINWLVTAVAEWLMKWKSSHIMCARAHTIPWLFAKSPKISRASFPWLSFWWKIFVTCGERHSKSDRFFRPSRNSDTQMMWSASNDQNCISKLDFRKPNWISTLILPLVNILDVLFCTILYFIFENLNFKLPYGPGGTGLQESLIIPNFWPIFSGFSLL